MHHVHKQLADSQQYSLSRSPSSLAHPDGICELCSRQGGMTVQHLVQITVLGARDLLHLGEEEN